MEELWLAEMVHAEVHYDQGTHPDEHIPPPAQARVGSVAFHRVAELLMSKMDEAAVAGDFDMATAYAQMAAGAEGRALKTIPEVRSRTRDIIRQSQWALVDQCMQFEARIAAEQHKDGRE